MTVRSMTTEDLLSVAAVHKAAYRSGQRTAHLPTSLLVRYYRSFLEHNRCYVAIEMEEVVGFLIGGPQTDLAVARSRFTRQCAPMLLLESLRNPRLLVEIVRAGVAFVKRRRHPADSERSSSAETSNTWTLLSIAVAPDFRRSRVARRLVEAFHEELLRENQRFYEASVLKTNAASQRLFHSVGGFVQRVGSEALVYRVPLATAGRERTTLHPFSGSDEVVA